MKRIGYIIVVCCLCLSARAQLNQQTVDAYIADVKAYESAVKDLTGRRPAQAVATLNDLIAKSEKTAGYPQKELASYYSARAQAYLRLKQYRESVTDCEHALTLLKKVGSEGRADQSSVWYKLALAYYYWGKSSESLQAADQCVETAKDYYGLLHSETLDAYSLRSNLAAFGNQKQVALNDRKEIFGIIQKNIERNFVYLTATERSGYWNKYMPETTHMYAFAHKMQEWQSDFTAALYNQQLLAKGLLLTAESALQRTVDNDPALRNNYQQIRQLRLKASDNKTLPDEADRAALEADRLERELGVKAVGIRNFLDFMKVHVSDVRQRLSNDDVAIEFVDYRVGKDSVMYAALILSPRWQHVRFLPLIEAKELARHTDRLAPYIWQSILDLLGYQPKNIYFAPSGMLYLYPVESHRLTDGRLMCEAYRMHRLSSTRWLSYKGDDLQGHDVVVYGGIAYDEDTDCDVPTTANDRGAVVGLPYLSGSKSEAELITQTINGIRQKGTQARMLLCHQATEASFKALSGQQTRILHIATHGFYRAGKKTETPLDDALQRSGLLFAGANNVWPDGPFNRGANDGVLTADEISSLDLRGLTLTVLSACETGQGDVSGDGVFGLQRGFKKAGAQSILMSLWKVDDEATCLLMTEFYRNWIEMKMSKHDALESAKNMVRSHKEKGWDNPKYWAAFILLDGLD